MTSEKAVDEDMIGVEKLEIRQNSTGNIRSMPQDYNGDFIWADGNFSCDCNRFLFWNWAIGVNTDDPEFVDQQDCGDTDFSVRITAIDDSRLLYQDGEGWK